MSDDPVICSVCRQVAEHPELRGKIFKRRDGGGTPMSYCATLIQIAGGMDRFLAEWEEDDYRPPRQLRDTANRPWEDE